jgi:hypothetical protein
MHGSNLSSPSRGAKRALRWLKPRVTVGAGLTALLIGGGLGFGAGTWSEPAFGQESEDRYRFFMREDLRRILDEDPDSIVAASDNESGVVFTDELAVLWPEARERPNRVGRDRYVLFDTELFHCAVPENQRGDYLGEIWERARLGYTEKLTEIEGINDQLHERSISPEDAANQRTAAIVDLYRLWRNQPIVTVYGRAMYADFFGQVARQATRAGVHTERITIIVDRVERPRQRWYDEGLDDG